MVLELARTRELAAQREAFMDAEQVLLVFPLYTDSTPGIVKNFLDSLAEAPPERLAGKEFAFVVHSGFPEAVHSQTVTRYLEQVARRLDMVHRGSAIRGGSEGLRLMPQGMTRSARALFSSLGRSLAAEGRFDPETAGRLSRVHHLGWLQRLALTVLKPTGLPDLYFITILKKHGAWKRRFDRPYASALGGTLDG